jgi:mannose-6-phosphate isomerase-like protein (cupin superfamily)
MTSTLHGFGQKKIFNTQERCNSQLMQSAMGILNSGDEVGYHLHPTIEKFYYFENGNTIFTIDGYSFSLASGTFNKVRANTFHSMQISENTRFIFRGTAL